MKKKQSILSTLPEPDSAQKALSQELVKHIKRHLTQGNGLSFSQFMELALYAPNLGYYANGLAKFGASGDFTTAPEISSLFGQCLARQLDELLRTLSDASVLELGAGSGVLACTILTTLAQLNRLPVSYAILEPSAALQERQRAYLSAHLPAFVFDRVVWLKQLPQNFVGVIVGNEVADALPVEVLRLLPNDAQQGYVVWDAQQASFVWDWREIVDAKLQDQANMIRSTVGDIPTQGYLAEVCQVLPAWMASLSESLQQGAILLIDYGYGSKEFFASRRWMGSLRAHYRHRAHNNPFWYPGLQDLTAHVNFTALAQAGFDAGLTVAGYTTQAHFLLALGITSLIDEDADVVTHLKLAQQIKTLTMPDEMGENFKAMVFLKEMVCPLTGFSLRDLRMSL
jgi:SAM-dependent MidA family methyltransferase